jgi:DNA-binding transcriptional MerR regulator
MERLRNLSTPKPKPKDVKWKALEYFIMGLTYDEVSKLTGINKRTLERYGLDENWKDQRQTAKDKERQKIIAEYLKTQRQNEPPKEKPLTKKQIAQKQKERMQELDETIRENATIIKNMKKAVRQANKINK